jgi:hypothetical protein
LCIIIPQLDIITKTKTASLVKIGIVLDKSAD